MIPLESSSRKARLACLAEQCAELGLRIERIEAGLERPDDSSLPALAMQRAGLREALCCRAGRCPRHGCRG